MNMGICIAIGTMLGLALGLAIDQPALGISVGIGGGLVVWSIGEVLRKRKNKDDDQRQL
ncbi:hypothetical protein AAK938_03165 [Aerococcaceae bacterium 50-4]